MLERVLAHRKGEAVFWNLLRHDLAERFGYVLMLDRGRLAEHGRFEELKCSGGALHKLLTAG